MFYDELSDTSYERAVLARAIIHEESLPTILSVVDPSDFYSDGLRRAYAAIVQLYNEKKDVNYIEVAKILSPPNKDREKYFDTLMTLSDLNYEPDIQNLGYFIKNMKEKARRRHLMDMAYKLQAGIDEGMDSDQAMEEIDKARSDIQARSDINLSTALEAVKATSEWLQELQQGKDASISTGLESFDKSVYMQGGDLIYLAARPSYGKTALALQIFRHNLRQGIPGMFFSMEMTKQSLIARMVSAMCGFNVKTAMRNNNERAAEILHYFSDVAKLPMVIDDAGRCSLTEIKSKISLAKPILGDVRFLIIDYLQLMKGPKGFSNENRQGQIEEISKSLKELAKELSIPIICLSQLNRNLEQRKDPRPRKSDLRDSGSLEQDADKIIFIHREKDLDGNLSPDGEIIFDKNRDGETGSIRTSFDGPTQTFTERAF